MYQILITSSSGPNAVHTVAVSFATETQAIAAAELVNASAAVNSVGEVFQHASLLFVPSSKQDSPTASERGFTIPGVDREAVHRVMDRFGQAVRNVEESKALEQVRTGFDRFVASAEQLMRRQTPWSASDTAAPMASREGMDSTTSQTAAARPIRFMRAAQVTEDQELAASRSPLAARGDMALVWVNEADLYGHEEVFPAP